MHARTHPHAGYFFASVLPSLERAEIRKFKRLCNARNASAKNCRVTNPSQLCRKQKRCPLTYWIEFRFRGGCHHRNNMFGGLSLSTVVLNRFVGFGIHRFVDVGDNRCISGWRYVDWWLDRRGSRHGDSFALEQFRQYRKCWCRRWRRTNDAWFVLRGRELCVVLRFQSL